MKLGPDIRSNLSSTSVLSETECASPNFAVTQSLVSLMVQSTDSLNTDPPAQQCELDNANTSRILTPWMHGK